MRIYVIVFSLVCWIAATALTACRKYAEEPPQAKSFELEVPLHFPKPLYNFQNNTVSQEGFELGRMLFYDPILSRDNSISCGSCHQQFAAFAHLDHPTSHGIDNQFTKRNSPAMYNLAWQKEFFWDGGVTHIENISIAPITNPLEMDERLDRVVYKLNRSDRYQEKFRIVFKKDTIDSQQLLKAITQFIGTMVSADSRYDRHVTKTPTLLPNELEGMHLFNQKCGTCHSAPLFTDFTYRNNGLNAVFTNDTGREHISTLAADIGKFKVPSLRNVALTAPYMHDGSMNTLDRVLEHYRTGVVYSETLDPSFNLGNGSYGIPITDDEKQKIIAFLNTLTDYTFIADPKFADPF